MTNRSAAYTHVNAILNVWKVIRAAPFSVCVGIVRVSGLRHGTIEVVSSSLLAPTLQNCVVHWEFWFAGQPDNRGLRNVDSYCQRHWKLVGTRYDGATPSQNPPLVCRTRLRTAGDRDFGAAAARLYQPTLSLQVAANFQRTVKTFLFKSHTIDDRRLFRLPLQPFRLTTG